jgi:hypothetical protein
MGPFMTYAAEADRPRSLNGLPEAGLQPSGRKA